MDRTPGCNEPEDAATPSSSSSGGDGLQQRSMDSKGKQKAWPGSAASRLEASTKLVVSAITTSREMPALTSESKSSSGPGGSISLSHVAGESSSYSSRQQTLFGQRRTAEKECQNDLFDSFVESSTDVLAADGYHVGISESSFANQEGLDGLAVADLLSQPRSESPSALLGQEDDLHAPDDGGLWLEAAIGTADDPEDQLDFTPDFLIRPELSEQATAYLGTGNPQETSRTWLGYWSEVFASYNARVWGSSHPTMPPESSGRDLQQEHGNTEPTTINRALTRLKQILYHLK
ncbi:hypothetical protein J3F83DRAFT_750537 [Trichoderma novae-zelandiae]